MCCRVRWVGRQRNDQPSRNDSISELLEKGLIMEWKHYTVYNVFLMEKDQFALTSIAIEQYPDSKMWTDLQKIHAAFGLTKFHSRYNCDSKTLPNSCIILKEV